MLVGAAAQPRRGQTGEKVGGNKWQERTQPMPKPQLDEVRIIESGGVERVQSHFSYGVQNHRQCGISRVQSL